MNVRRLQCDNATPLALLHSLFLLGGRWSLMRSVTVLDILEMGENILGVTGAVCLMCHAMLSSSSRAEYPRQPRVLRAQCIGGAPMGGGGRKSVSGHKIV
eukprot:scaffold232468_cov29-Tisochrysis_lutea.AAC.5